MGAIAASSHPETDSDFAENFVPCTLLLPLQFGFFEKDLSVLKLFTAELFILKISIAWSNIIFMHLIGTVCEHAMSDVIQKTMHHSDHLAVFPNDLN